MCISIIRGLYNVGREVDACSSSVHVLIKCIFYEALFNSSYANKKGFNIECWMSAQTSVAPHIP